ncbi:hypothetical protein CLOM_g10768 [Closterium sp. NIES-68]|nr:hypothetical protein CLOM_g10768 [Closterium sp. NIES-68]GJP58084.1 hypothetical protein CLOP_g20418 [Closterium sp. NIES-67]
MDSMQEGLELCKRFLFLRTVGSFGIRRPVRDITVNMSLVDAIQSLLDSEAEHGIISVGRLPDDFTRALPANEAYAAGALRMADLVAWAVVELDLLYASVQAHHGLPVDSRETKVAIDKASKKPVRDSWKSAVASISGGPSPCKAASGTSACEECPSAKDSRGSGRAADQERQKQSLPGKLIVGTLLWQLQELQHYVRVPLSAMAHSTKCLPVFPLTEADNILHVLQILAHVDGSVVLLPPNKGHSNSIITQEDMFHQVALIAQHDPWASYLEQVTVAMCSAAVVQPVRVRAACSLPEAVRAMWVCNVGEAVVQAGEGEGSPCAYDVMRLRDLELLLDLNCSPAGIRRVAGAWQGPIGGRIYARRSI